MAIYCGQAGIRMTDSDCCRDARKLLNEVALTHATRQLQRYTTL